MAKLITGGTGFIGAELAHRLVERGEDIILFDVAPNYERIEGIKDKAKVVPGDLKVWPEVLNVVKENNIEGIYHLGSMLSVPSEANPWASFQINVVGTMHVLEAARLFGVDRIVFASSAATYGLGTSGVVTDETIQRPTTMYGCGKLYCELLGRFYRTRFDLDFRSVRYPSVVGPGSKTKHVSIYNAWMIEKPALGEPFQCFVTEETKIPAIYFKDAARAADLCYQAPKEKIQTVNYNVSGIAPARTAKELELAVKKFIPDARITYEPDPEVMEFYRAFRMEVFDDSKAREEWGWEPRYTDIDEVVADFIEEIRLHPKRYGLA
ncbi:MAG TPA: NAD-dependent epimerase/dehydratase family protein [Dehalococcoidia bacterium]|nr:NAD-dependent epimerase/dehydratase family protein [Dehalococcoidia bacterium]